MIGRPDAWFDDVGVAWEIDSRAFHYGVRDYERTLARNSRYAAAGILVLQTLPTRLRDCQEAVERELRKAHEVAAARTRPPVRIVGR